MKLALATVPVCCLSMILIIASESAQAEDIGLPDNGFEVAAPVEGSTSADTPVSLDGTTPANSKRLTDILKNGGPLMIPILFSSFVLVVFTFERLISLRKGRIVPNPFARKFVEQLSDGTLEKDAAIELCERDGSPIAQVFQAGIQKWGKTSVEVEQAVLDEGERQSNCMRRYLRLINGIATVCPLLGLLGTVLGMIHAFDAISAVTAETVDPKILIATGISQALLTTAAGMTVAIPALIAYMYFSSRVDQRVMEIDSLAMQVVRNVCAEAELNRSKTKTKTSRKAAA